LTDSKTMPVKLDPLPPANSSLPGITTSLLYNGSRFQGHQKSKGNCYDVEVILQVKKTTTPFCFKIVLLYYRHTQLFHVWHIRLYLPSLVVGHFAVVWRAMVQYLFAST